MEEFENEEYTYFDVFYGKKGNPEDIEIPASVIIHRISLFTPKYLELCKLLDRNVYYKDDLFLKNFLFKVIAKEKYMPSTKDVKEALEKRKQLKEKTEVDEFDWLYDMICKRYCWSIEEKKMYKPIYYNMFKDYNKLRYFFRFFGIPKSKCEKYGVKI